MKNRVINDSVNRITQHYGNGHNGVDLGWRTDESQNKVYANCKGVVYEIQTGIGNIPGATGVKSWGNYVLIKHPNGMFTRYAHLQEVYVRINQEVDENSCVGLIGNTGNSKGRHLHFEVANGYSSSTRINPEPYLDKPVYINSKSKYCAYDNVKNKWLTEVEVGSNDYAGNLGNGVSGLMIQGKRYRVHDKVKNKWLGWIEKYDTNDSIHGYAGNLPNDIDGVQIENATYRVHIKGQGWLSWVSKVDNTSNGYAGIYGKTIDAIQIRID